MRPPEPSTEPTPEQTAADTPLEQTAPDTSFSSVEPTAESALSQASSASAPSSAIHAEGVPQSPPEHMSSETPPPIMPPTQTVVPAPAPMAASVTKQPRNKKRIILASVIAAIVVLVGGGAAAWAFWYQNPDKVVMDGLFNTMNANQAVITGAGNLTSKNADLGLSFGAKSKDGAGSTETVLKLKVKSEPLAGKEFTITVNSLMVKDGDFYFKVKNVDEALRSLVDAVLDAQVKQYSTMGYSLNQREIDQYRAQMTQQLSAVTSKIDNQWIKVSSQDLKSEQSKSDKESACVMDEFKKIGSDQKIRSEIADLYSSNRFIRVKDSLGTKDGSLGYLIDVDQDASKKFGEGLKTTELGKALVKCDEDFFKESTSTTSDNKGEFKDTRFELWIDQWSHKITRVVLSAQYGDGEDDAKMSSDMKFDYSTPTGDFTAPSDAKSIKELQTEIQSVLGVVAPGLASSET